MAESDGNRIRRVATSGNGVVTTVSGNGNAGFSGDGGPANAAVLNRPSSIAVAADGTIYFFDLFNARVRRIANNVISTIAGNPNSTFVEGPGLLTNVGFSTGIALDSAGANLYVSDERGNRVRRIRLSDGAVTLVAGTGARGFSGDDGPAVRATFNTPTYITVGSGNSILLGFEQ